MADLTTNEQLVGFPGAPFSTAVLQAACESVRDDCGWHVAPPVTETIEVPSDGTIVYLYSLHVVSVSAVRNAETDEVLEGWRLDARAGVLHRTSWPRTVAVDLTHGYDVCPPALKPLIADRANAMTHGGYVQRESVGARSVTIERLGPDAAKYALSPRP